jgi:predicted ATPase
VGRQTELADLLCSLDAAVSGRGSVVVVTGEAGLGKTRLLRELEDQARSRDVVVLTGAAVEDGPAYRPLAQALLPALRSEASGSAPSLRPYRAALGRLLPDWADAEVVSAFDMDPALVLGEGVVRLLADLAGEVGCLLVIDDAHWADPDSLALLQYVVSAVRDTRVLVAVSARDDLEGTAAVRRLAGAPGATVLPLAPLTPTEVEELAQSRAGGP